MKYFILLALMSLFVACGQNSSSDENKKEIPPPKVITLENFNLKGKITSVTQEISIVNIDEKANILGKSENNTNQTKIKHLFNNDGIWVKTELYMNDKIYSTTEALFTEDGNYDGAIQKDIDRKTIGEIKLVEFTETKRVEETYFNDKLQFRNTQKLSNHVPQKIKNESYFNSKITITTTNVYDDNNQVVEYFIEEESNGVVQGEKHYKVKYLEIDDNGNWTQRLDYIEGEKEGIMYSRSFK